MEIFVYGTNPCKYVLADDDRACIEEVCGLYFAALSKYAEECGVSHVFYEKTLLHTGPGLSHGKREEVLAV